MTLFSFRKFALSLVAVAVLAAVSLGAQGVDAAGAAAKAGGQGQKPNNSNVTSTVHDLDAAGNLLLIRSDNYNGSVEASYNSGVTSTISSDGILWMLYLGNQTLRKLWLTFPADGVAPPSGLYSANTELYAKCFDASGTLTGLQAIPPDVPNTRCALGVDFSIGGVKYRLAMSPAIPGTGWATVTCNAVDGTTGQCNSWTIVPNMIDGAPTVATLFTFNKRGQAVSTGHQYYSTNNQDFLHRFEAS